MESDDIVFSSIRSGMKREFAMLMKAQLEMGALPAGPRRMTRSQSSSSFCRSSKGINAKAVRVYSKRMKKDINVKAIETHIKDMNAIDDASKEEGARVITVDSACNKNDTQRNEPEKFCSDLVQPMSTDSASLIEVDTNPRDDSESFRADLECVEELEVEKLEVGSCSEVATTLAVANSGDLSHEFRSPFADDLIAEFESNGDSSRRVSVQPVRRFTRSCLKLQDGHMESLNSSGIVEAAEGVITGFETNGESARRLSIKHVRRFTRSCLRLKHDYRESINSAELVETAEGLIKGSESNGESACRLSMKPVRRFTRSCLKRQDEYIESVNGVGMVETAEGLITGFESNEESARWRSMKPVRRFTRSCLKLQDDYMESVNDAGMVEIAGTSTASSNVKCQIVKLKRVPKRVKDLLKTGLLEGLRVRYVHGLEVDKEPNFELRGIIQGTGILCFCDVCDGRKAVTPNKFELHAHSGNKSPPECIYLENGKSLRNVLNLCKANDSDSGSVVQVILDAIGCSNSTTALCHACKGIIPEADADSDMLLCNACFMVKERDADRVNVSDCVDRPPLPISSASISSTSLHDVLDVEQISSNNPQPKRQGRVTRKDLRMHKFVFSEDILPDGTALSYFMHGKKRLDGVKRGGGILCMCCNEVVSPSQFEGHAGFPSRRKPYMSIYTSNGVSLHQLSLELSKNRRIYSPDENDDLCSICEDGGDLLCCENCPRSFHSECIGMSTIPEGKWYCKYCQGMYEREKFSENDANAIAAGWVPGVDPLAEISQRCIRIIGAFATDVGGCAICREHDFSSPEFTDRTVILCDQCEREYHVGCLRENEMDDLKALPDGEWFCCKQCGSINSAIQKLVLDGEKGLADDLLSHIMTKKKRREEEQRVLENDHPIPTPHSVKWRIISGKDSSEDTRAWLSGAVSIFHDCFDPIADASTGRHDLIPHMVYGRQFKDRDFCGIHCAMLTVDCVVVSAGLFRVFGEDVAELPLVATRSDSQGNGYFQCLYHCIENFLKSQNVKDLVLPAADEAESLWKNRFGFRRIGQEQLGMYKRSYQMMIFEGTAVLHKRIAF